MSEIKYKGIDLKAIKEVQTGLKNCKVECFEFSEEKLLESLETDETVMGHILGVIKRIEMQQREATDMYIICEMARLWLKHCRDMQEIVKRLEGAKVVFFDDYTEEYEDVVFLDEAIEIVKKVGGMYDY